jgi:hypothetical protein
MPHDSFVLYKEIKEVVSTLSLEDAGILFNAILEYENTGSIPELSPLVNCVFIPIKQNLDRNREKYERIKQERKDAGALGGRRKAENLANVANASFAKQNLVKPSKRKQNLANVAVNVHVPVNDNDTKIVSQERNLSHEKSHATCKKQKNDYTPEFEEFWKCRPVRDGTNNKYDTYKQWRARIKEGEDYSKMINGLRAYHKHCGAKGIVGSSHVMTVERFIGKSKHYLDDWEVKKNVTSNRKSEAEKLHESANNLRKRYHTDGKGAGEADGDISVF